MANHTILLIDYEPKSIEKVRRPLTGFGYSVEVATDGIAGMEAFHRLKPDLVMIEAMIPKKHGFEVCQEIKKTPQGKRTPIIITTSVYKGRKYRNQAFHIHGCDEYLEKPLEEDQILAVCRRMLGDTGEADLQPLPTPDELDPVVEPDPGYQAETSYQMEPAAVPEFAPPPTLDDDEMEILARLDAILPGSSSGTSSPSPAQPAAMVSQSMQAAPASPAQTPAMGGNGQSQSSRSSMSASAVASAVEEGSRDPFATSFLGSGASSDLANQNQQEAVLANEPVITVEEVGAEPADDSQVVSFESRRSRKKDKKAKKGARSSASDGDAVSTASIFGRDEAGDVATAEGASDVKITASPATSALDDLLSEPRPLTRPWWISVGLALLLIGAAAVLMYVYLGGLFTAPGH